MQGNPLRRARGALTIARHLPGQRRALYRPREEILAARDARVREMVRHAAAHVPYYRELFRRERIDPGAIRSADALASLPLLERLDLQRDPESLRSTAPPARDGVLLRTSGSTGAPIEVFHERRAALANCAYSERERAVLTALLGRRYGYKVLRLGSGNPSGTSARVDGFLARSSYRPSPARRVAASLDDRGETALETLARERPDAIVGSGSYLEMLVRTLAAGRPRAPLPKVAVYVMDAMSPEARAIAEEELGIAVLSHYNAVECFKIGFVCEERTGFHLHEDLCHLRLVDSEGRPVPEGERGEVVVSNLFNRGTVLLNYRLGDFAREATDGCPCGRRTRRLLDLEGRVSELIRLPGGAVVHPNSVAILANRLPSVARWQLVQRAPDAFELRVVTLDPEVHRRAAGDVIRELERLLGGCRVEGSLVDELAPEPGRKLRPIVLLDRDEQGVALPPA